jgi:hypothetical protein
VLYACHTLFLVEHPIELGFYTAWTLGIVGVAAVYINWDADMQKMRYVMPATMPVFDVYVSFTRFLALVLLA